ncbi:MAG TPA: TrfB-related DNA-binding protein [Solirubrobacteraceae bacterium]
MVVIVLCMTSKSRDTQKTFQRLKEVRAQAIKHTLIARELSRERRTLLHALIADGHSQAEIARELGVTRQAIQKMLAMG